VTSDARLWAVIDAAAAVLAARDDKMLTSEEWDALASAVAACREPDPSERTEDFAVEHDHLVQRVVPAPGRGEPYEHRCSEACFGAVAWAVDEAAAPFTLEDLCRAADVPWTQAAVAFAFMKERGVVIPAHGRTHDKAGEAAYEDAMTEWHALREGAPGSR
jgi:hypothetical protein